MSVDRDLHKLLIEIAPGLYSPEEESKIVAVASNIFHNSTTTIKQASLNKIKIAKMTDSLLQAMGELNDWQEPVYIDGRGLSPEQIIRKAANGSQMELVNDSDVLSFLDVPEEPIEFFIDDTHEINHPPAVFGDKPKQWPDSLKR